ncbi:hypothetical protein VN97_g11296, partial [Penicillium thymicola]
LSLFSPSLLFSFNALFHSKSWLVASDFKLPFVQQDKLRGNPIYPYD